MGIGDKVGEGWEDQERIWSKGREVNKEVVVRGTRIEVIRIMREEGQKTKKES